MRSRRCRFEGAALEVGLATVSPKWSWRVAQGQCDQGLGSTFYFQHPIPNFQLPANDFLLPTNYYLSQSEAPSHLKGQRPTSERSDLTPHSPRLLSSKKLYFPLCYNGILFFLLRVMGTRPIRTRTAPISTAIMTALFSPRLSAAWAAKRRCTRSP